MKVLVFFVLLFVNAAFADSGYEISIDQNGYLMKMTMEFPKSILLKTIKQTLRNGFVLSELSPNVKSVVNTPENADAYASLMTVKSFGVTSLLMSECKEVNSEIAWSRNCKLSVNSYDGGKYMEWKEDYVSCETDKSAVICRFEIKGKARPVKVLGIQIMNDRLFSVKAKYSALNNFFKYYFYIKSQTASVKLALHQFNRSKVHDELEKFNDVATAALKKELSFKTSYRLINE